MSAQNPTRSLESYDAVGFAEWVRLMSNRFVPLSLTTGSPESFTGALRSRTIGDIGITYVEASSHSVHRLSKAIRIDKDDHLKLSLQLEGTGLVMQDGRSAHLNPGDVAIYDTSRPYTLEYQGDMSSLVMIFPHSLLGLSASLVHTVTATRLAGDVGIGRVICPFMQHMAENLDQLEGVDGARIMRSAFDLITAMISAEIRATSVADDASTAFESLCMYIDKHLPDSELCIDSIARANFISTRQLQYIFQQEGQTVSSYMRSRRLERCRIDLEDPALHDHTVLQIAQASGFMDLSHFSKLFKATYGVSPREHRLSHM